jgi:putative acetyltransferase
METVLREVKKSDNAMLAKIIRQTFTEHDAPQHGTVYSDPTTDDLYSLFRKEGSVLLVAEEEGDILGCCGLYPTDGLPAGCVELVKFYLKKEARGKGTGRALMEKCLSLAVENGYKEIYLESLPQFSRAVSMYEKLGFKVLDHSLGDSGHRTCHIWMLRKL